jgi:guanidinoacetate N-methyltransferase
MKVDHSDERLALAIELLDGFVRAPTDDQRRLILRRVAGEAVDELAHMDSIAPSFVPNQPFAQYSQEWKDAPARYSDSELLIDGHEVMQDWEAPLMRAMAERAAASHGDVLEIGFGMGISATYIQSHGVRSHTIVECNDDVIEEFDRWRARLPGAAIRLIRGYWEETVDLLEQYDGVLYDPYPTAADGESAPGTTSIQEDPFYAVAAQVLRPDGVFSHYTDEIDSLSRPHQRFLLEYFERIEVEIVGGLRPPAGCTYFWADSMAVVSATRPRPGR